MTFAQLKANLLGTADVPGSAFPLGTPENLRPQCEGFVLEALIEIQRWIECWRVGHIDVVPARFLMVQNGCTVATKPAGAVDRVYTIATTTDGAGWDHPVNYAPVELAYLRRWMSRFRASFRYPSFVSPPGREGFRAATQLDDSPYGRALTGVWSLDGRTDRLIVGPWLQSNESLVIEWTGIKRTWGESDIVSDNPDFTRLVKLWVLQEYGRHWASSDLQVRVDTWNAALADAIVTCRESRLLPPDSSFLDENGETRAYYRANPPSEPGEQRTSVGIAFVGDTGMVNDAERAVAAQVIAHNPDLVVIAGDVVYQPNSVAAAIAPYTTFLDDGRLVVALGNHDCDLNDGEDVLAYVNNPGNTRYFSVPVGSVEVFVVNTGITSAGLYVEPDGNFAGSIQAREIQAMILRSCARWKILVLHHPPYTSGSSYWPGIAVVRWASDLEVHAVISGHSHSYERGTFRGRRHVIVGTGGGTLTGFVAEPLSGSEIRIANTFGCLLLEATETTAAFSFVGTDGSVLDTFNLAGDPPYPSTIPPESVVQTFNDTIQAGADYILPIFDRDPNGQASNLTGCTALMQLRRSLSDPVDLQLSSPSSGITIDPLIGRIDVSISNAQSSLLFGTYVYSIELTFPDSRIERLIQGTFNISPRIVV